MKKIPLAAPEQTYEEQKAQSDGASQFLDKLGKDFVKIRRSSSSPKAWSHYYDEIMSHQGVLVPTIVGFKDFMSMMMQCEDYIRGAVSHRGDIPVDQVLLGLQKLMNLGSE